MTDTPSDPVDAAAVRRATALRLITGLAQGLLLYGLFKAGEAKVWPATQRELYAALWMVVLFVPFVVQAGASALRFRTLAIWKGVAVVTVAALAAYGVWSGDAAAKGIDALKPQTFCAIAALLFIGHHLVQPADMERRRIARFPTYFDVTWKHGVQAVLSLGFTGAFWLLLFLASALFKLIGIKAIEALIQHEAFAFPATAVMFAAAVQLTDVRAALVRGVRTVALTLLAWLLPLMALIAAAFLLTLPFTGLEPLWKTKSATAILLTADAFLILLTNAAYQDGTEKTAVLLKWAARLAGVLLAPITVLAAYGLSLRIGQYGLSPDRIIAAACVLVAAGYAVGYTLAAVRPGAWMKALEAINIAMAFGVIVVLLALLTPVADPRRLSVKDQVARLESGKVKAADFDYVALRFDDGRYGREALQALRRHRDPAVRIKATDAAGLEYRPYDNEMSTTSARYAATRVFPVGQALPKSFAEQAWGDESAPYCRNGDRRCRAVLIDTDGDGAAEVLLGGGAVLDVYKVGANGVWKKVGRARSECGGPDEKALEAGDVHVAPSTPSQDLVVGGKRMRIEPPSSCDVGAQLDALSHKRP